MQATTTEFHPIYFPYTGTKTSLNTSGTHRRVGKVGFLNSALFKELPERPFQDLLAERRRDYLDSRLNRLEEIFKDKIEAHPDYFEGIDIESVKKSTFIVAEKVLQATNPERFTVDFTEDASVILTLIFPKNKNAYLELYFEPGIQEPVQHVVLISENKENVFAYTGSFLESLSAFMNEMSPVSLQISF